MPFDLKLAVPGPVRTAFETMRMADEALAKRWPGRTGEPRAAFLLCRPPEGMLSPVLRRSHISEILERIPDDPQPIPWAALERMTRAEVVWCLSEASLRHPLTHMDTLVFETLYRTIDPGGSTHLPPGDILSNETEREVRSQLTELLGKPSPHMRSVVAEVRGKVE